MTDVEYIVAVDYGTTRTGYAWCVKGCAEKAQGINFDQDWPRQPSVQKADSAIVVDREGKVVAWGRDALARDLQQGHVYCERVKMDLFDPASNRSPEVQVQIAPDGPYRVVNGQRYSSVGLISQLLGVMRKRAVSSIRKALRLRDDDRQIAAKTKWVVTIPANSSDAQKKLMRTAAIQAQLISDAETDAERLWLAFEPEMAAVACRFNSRNKRFIDTEHVLLVIDAGGGTVDVSAYRYNPTEQQVTQVAESHACTAGSTYLDIEFVKHLGRLFTSPAVSAFKHDRREEWLEIMYGQSSWESAKMSASLDSEDLVIPLRPFVDFLKDGGWKDDSDSLARALENLRLNRYRLPIEVYTEQICRPVFERAMIPIREVLEQLSQKRERCDLVYFVGGLGCSPHFEKYVRSELAKDLGDEVFCSGMNMQDKTAAVLTGAALCGDNPARWIPQARISHWTYGVSCRALFDPETHSTSRAQVVHDHAGNKRIENGIQVYVERGSSVSVDMTRVHTFTPCDHDQKVLKVRLLCSERRIVHYSDDPGVRELDSVELDLPGEGYDRPVEVVMRFGETEVWVEAKNKEFPDIRRKTTLTFPWTLSSELVSDA